MERSVWKDTWNSFRKLQKDGGSEKALQLLKQLVKESLKENNRKDVTADDLSMLSDFVNPLLLAIRSGHVTTSDVQWGAALEGIKLTRNLIAGIRENQDQLIDHSTLLSAVVTVCYHLSSVATIDDKTTELFKVALQLLGNLCVCHPEGQEKVWSLCYPELFRCCLECGCLQPIDVTCMILYTCLRENVTFRMEFGHLMDRLLRCLETVKDPLEWRDLLLDFLISQTPLRSLWKQCSLPKEGVALLKYILCRVTEFTADDPGQFALEREWLTEDVNSSQPHTHDVRERSETQNSSGYDVYVAMTKEENVAFLHGLFSEHAQYLLSDDAAVLARISARRSEGGAVNEMDLIVCTLNLLNSVCVQRNVLSQLQGSSELLHTTLELLKSLSHLDGSADSARHRSRLAVTKPTGDEKLHPFFGFKRDLVRLLANLSYGSREVQLFVNESGAFPLILNQCSIDHHNPYITQWTVLAIRNLCEGNPANQKLVAALEAQGPPNTAELLQQLGCEVKVGKDGKMKVKSHEKES